MIKTESKPDSNPDTPTTLTPSQPRITRTYPVTLQQHSMRTDDSWSGTRTGYVVEMIKNATDERLQQLHGFLTSEAGGEQALEHSPWTGDRLRMFCSHLADQRAHVGEVGDFLSRFGIESFIAHDAIDPSKEWAKVIEGALSSCDALAVFLHPGFRDSAWCSQEVGWVMGRKRPVLPLNYGIPPFGFIEKLQYQSCSIASPQKVALSIVDWLTKTPSVHARLTSGLVNAFVNSSSWNFTRLVVPFLERMKAVSDDDLGRMEVAAQVNIDVKNCQVAPGLVGPEWVRDYVAARRRPTDAPTVPAFPEPAF